MNKKIKFASLFLVMFAIASLISLFSPHTALASGFTLAGSVQDNSGSKINGATVDIYSPGTTNDVVPATTTDQNGNYTFLNVPQGTYDIEVTPPSGSNFSSAIALNQNISSDTVLNFVLTSSGTVILKGHVYDEQGHALINQTVFIVLNGNTIATATTDSTGSYSLTTSSGTYDIHITNQPHQNSDFSQNIPQIYSITASNYQLTQDTTLDFSIPARQVTVHVQDEAGQSVSGVGITTTINTPLSGLSIGGGITNAIANSSQYFAGPQTDQDGNATLWLLPNNNSGSSHTYTFTATPPSGSNFSTTTLSNQTLTSDTNLPPIILQQPVTLSGHVYDEGGHALINQTVFLASQGGGTIATATTDSTGGYSLSASAGTYNLNVTNQPHQNSDFSQDIPQIYSITASNYQLTQDTTLDFSIPARQVTVHIQNEAGQAISDVAVSTSINTPLSGLSIGGGITDASANSSQYFAGPQTDQEGNVTLWLLPNSNSGSSHTYTFTATPPSGSSFSTATLSNIVITNDTQKTIVLQQPVTLSGHVYDEGGHALTNQTVFLVAPGGNTIASTTTDSTGSYSLNSITGTYDIHITNQPHQNSDFSQDIPQIYSITASNYQLTQDTTLDFSIPARKVIVHVQNAANQPVSGITLTAEAPGNHINDNQLSIGGSITNAKADSSAYFTGPQTDQNGDATLWLLANGNNYTYTFTATPPSESIYNIFTLSNISVTSDETELVQLEYNHATPVTTATLSTPFSDGLYPDPTTVTLSASAAAGYTVANTYYTVDGGAQQTYTTPFTVTGTGSHTITYWSVDNSGVTEAANTQTFTITEAYNLTGTVYIDANQNGVQDPGENGYANATVSLNTGQTTTTDANGNYSFPNTESGSYVETLTVPAGYLATTTNPVNVALAADTTVNFGIAVPTPTATPTPTVTPTPTQVPTTTVTFDDINVQSPLNGNYSGINWGTNAWDVDSAIATDNTHSASFHSSGVTSETFSFTSPQVLISTGIYSNSTQPALITVSCAGNPSVSQRVNAGQTATLTTNWTTACTTVTITSSNGWNTNLDNIVYAASSSASPTPTPTPSGQILGNTQIGTQVDTGDTGFMNGTKFTTGVTGGTAQSMSVFVGNIDNATHSQYQMAIYTDNNGVPGTLIASTATGNLTALDWNALPITATLQANTTYWLMYNTNGRAAQDLNNMYYNPGTQGVAAFAKHTFGTWPTNFPAATLDTPVFSIYVTY